MTADTRVPLRVEAAQLKLVLDHLDRAESMRDVAAKRRYARHVYRTVSPVVIRCRRADGAVCYEAVPRNISTRGISVLFGAFIYPQTECSVILPTLAGRAMQVPATLRWCRHISRAVHEGGVEFTDRLDLSLVLERAPDEEAEDSDAAVSYFHRVVERQAARLASLAHDQRSVQEIREAFDKIRRAIDREDPPRANWIQ